MLIKRTAMWLLAWAALVSLVGPALAQPPANSNLDYQTPTPSYENAGAKYSNDTPENNHSFFPFNPVHFEPTLDLFGPANTSGYGNGPRQHIGYFGSYERVFWSLSKPSTADIGSPNTGQINPLADFSFQPFPDGPTLDNSYIGATGAWGNRYEVGYVDTDNYGWLVGVLDHVKQNQYLQARSPAIGFDDPSGILLGTVPVTLPPILGGFTFPALVQVPTVFAIVNTQNVLELNGVELMRSYRTARLHHGGHFQLLYGARWLQINDTFIVTGFGNGNTVALANVSRFGGPSTPISFTDNILDSSTWSTRVINNIVGPQIGGRWEKQRGRWITSLEARFAAGANFQNATQKTRLGTQTVNNQRLGDTNISFDFQGLGSNTHQFTTTFAPIGEIRLNSVFQITSNVGLKVGYTGLVVGDISRASNRVDYTGPNLVSILNGNTHQVFFANGVNFGIEVNR